MQASRSVPSFFSSSHTRFTLPSRKAGTGHRRSSHLSREPGTGNLGWLAPGLIVSAIGVVFVLGAAGVLKANETIDRDWPVAIIIAALFVTAFGLVGALGLAEIRASIVLGPLLTAVGVVLLLFTTHILGNSDWQYVWAGLAVLAGVMIAARSYGRASLSSAREEGVVRYGAFRIGSRMRWCAQPARSGRRSSGCAPAGALLC